jgi:putative CocE/NonD family hydrolase
MGTGDGRKDSNGRLFHGGYWKTANGWPLPDAMPTIFYLRGDGTLSRQAPPETNSSTTFTYDPRHPVPTIGGSFTTQRSLVAAGGWDQRERECTDDPQKGFLGSRPPYLPLKARQDVLVFQTAPLAEDTEVFGPVEITLFASSTAVDTDFTAKLVDVYPPSRDYPAGYDLNITDGIIRAHYGNSPERQELLKPGEIYRFRIEPFPIGNVFKKGHRIRVDISSSNFPRFDVNPNTGEPLGMNRRVTTADNTIYHDATHPSHVVLSIVEKRATHAGAHGRYRERGAPSVRVCRWTTCGHRAEPTRG